MLAITEGSQVRLQAAPVTFTFLVSFLMVVNYS
jgi:hypothetical protein